MEPLETKNLLWYPWKRNSWMLDRYHRFDTKLGSGQDYWSNLLMCRFDLP